MERIKNYINGKWVDSNSGETFHSINPANKDEVVGVVSKSGREEVDEAVKVARKAYESWRLTPAPRRGEILFRAAELLLKNKPIKKISSIMPPTSGCAHPGSSLPQTTNHTRHTR